MKYLGISSFFESSLAGGVYSSNMRKALIELYSKIDKYSFFQVKSVCHSCPRLCKRPFIWHWLFREEAARLINHLDIQQIEGAFFFNSGLCPKLHAKTCSIYVNRPLECRLSPLSLFYTEKDIWWIIDSNCPYYLKYKGNNDFWRKIFCFIQMIEPFIDDDMENEIIRISTAIIKTASYIDGKKIATLRNKERSLL